LTDGEWIEAETNTHQDHVVAHVVGATVLGYFVHDEVLHLLLDIGFFWIVYVDCEMGLVAESTTISELDASDRMRAQLTADADALRRDGASASRLAIMRAAHTGCLIEGVALYASGARRRLIIRGEESSLAVETSVETCEIDVQEF
jgi:hypothetical protein